MELNTSRFGKIKYISKNVIVFLEGLPGFSQFNKYIIIDQKKHRPFMWLQCIENENLAFVVTNPYMFVNSYFVNIPDEDLKALNVPVVEDLRILVMVVIPKDNPQEISINLQGPIFINIRDMTAKQVILYNSNYQVKHFIFSKIQTVETQMAYAE
ncbi:flagellar assembly protein FliW [Candidatus Desantisbacteria bacterium]|nr:flagellar assembly protein FliW [Candidatus Desantisbacteria bacterium]